MTRAWGAALSVALVAVGAASGLAAVAVHDTAWGWPLAVGSVLVVLVALPSARWARAAFCLAWGATVFGLAVPRPDGDYVVSADLRGYGLLLVALVVVLVGVFTLARRHTRTDTKTAPASP